MKITQNRSCRRARRICAILIVAAATLGIVLLGSRAPVARAQGSCYDFGDFPTGWTITHGHVIGPPYSVLGDTVYNLPSGVQGKIAGVQYGYNPERMFWSVTVAYLYDGPVDVSWPHLHLSFYRAGVEIAVRDYDVPRGIFGGWHDYTVDNLGGLTADTVQIKLWHALEGHTPDEVWPSLYPKSICSSAVVTATPSPTFEPETVTATSSNTPTNWISPTPSDTVTLTPSWTPSLTLTGATGTPGPTYTDVPTTTSTAVQAGGDIFYTPQGPSACDDVFNPCGALPFPVPGFPTVDLPSPTPAPSVSPAPGFMSPTVSATPGGTPGTGTPSATATGTPGPVQTAQGIYQTAMSNAVAYIGTPGTMYDPNGVAGDVVNAGNQIGSYIGGFWGFLRAIQTLFLGRAGTIIAFLLLVALYILLVRFFLFIIPILLRLLGWLLDLIGAIIPL